MEVEGERDGGWWRSREGDKDKTGRIDTVDRPPGTSSSFSQSQVAILAHNKHILFYNDESILLDIK